MKRLHLEDDGKLVRWLRSQYQHKDIRMIAREIAEEILKTTKQQNPPVNLRLFYPIRHINEKRVPTMNSDGRLVLNNDGFLLESRGGIETRQRFTIAHEIAHTFLYDLSQPSPRKILYGINTKEEEIFCNILASEILMPSSMIYQELKGFSIFSEDVSPIAALQRFARMFRVSLEAMTRRFIEDLEIIKGIVLSTRWLPGVEKNIGDNRTITTWRLWWSSVSPEISDLLYLPPVNKRPRLNLDILDQSFAYRTPHYFQVPLSNIRLGNLKKILSQIHTHSDTVGCWAYPILPKGLQLHSNIKDAESNAVDESTFIKSPDANTDNNIERKRSEIIIFFPMRKS